MSLIPVLLLTGNVTLRARSSSSSRTGSGSSSRCSCRSSSSWWPAFAETNRLPFDLPEAGVGADRRLSHRVQRDEVLDVLHRRVREHGDGVGDDGDAVLRRVGHSVHPLGSTGGRRPADGVDRRVQFAQDVLLPVPVHLGPLDAAALPLRSAHGAGVEGDAAARARVHHGDRPRHLGHRVRGWHHRPVPKLGDSLRAATSCSGTSCSSSWIAATSCPARTAGERRPGAPRAPGRPPDGDRREGA